GWVQRLTPPRRPEYAVRRRTPRTTRRTGRAREGPAGVPLGPDDYREMRRLDRDRPLIQACSLAPTLRVTSPGMTRPRQASAVLSFGWTDLLRIFPPSRSGCFEE